MYTNQGGERERLKDLEGRRSKWAHSWSENVGEMESVHGALVNRFNTSLYTSLLLRRERTMF
jgi:hypothetical protein